jgi:hypothetical protein
MDNYKRPVFETIFKHLQRLLIHHSQKKPFAPAKNTGFMQDFGQNAVFCRAALQHFSPQ